jgi:hypothetical protein
MLEVLDDIPFRLSLDGFQEKSGLRRVTGEIEKDVNDLITLIHTAAKPKAVYRVSYVSQKNEDSVQVDDVKLSSRVLRMNLDEVGRVFPYVATCGTEADQIEVPPGNMMKAYYLDTLKEMVLEAALSYLEDYLSKRYALGQISQMEPGSLDTWPITQQQELFSIVGDVERLVGVRLTERFLMIPLKSVSGIYFPTEIKFESCQLCQRARCPQRRAPFNSDVAEKYA